MIDTIFFKDLENRTISAKVLIKIFLEVRQNMDLTDIWANFPFPIIVSYHTTFFKKKQELWRAGNPNTPGRIPNYIYV